MHLEMEKSQIELGKVQKELGKSAKKFKSWDNEI